MQTENFEIECKRDNLRKVYAISAQTFEAALKKARRKFNRDMRTPRAPHAEIAVRNVFFINRPWLLNALKKHSWRPSKFQRRADLLGKWHGGRRARRRDHKKTRRTA